MDTPRSNESECKRKIKEKIYNLLDSNKYKEIINSQQGNFNPSNYKPKVTKFFSKNKNIDFLIKDLYDLQRDYEQFKNDVPFKDFVQKVIHSIEISKVGAQLDNKVTEHLKTYKDFIQNGN